MQVKTKDGYTKQQLAIIWDVMERYRPVDIFYYDEISVESPYK
jgi:hypothetical protein